MQHYVNHMEGIVMRKNNRSETSNEPRDGPNSECNTEIGIKV